MTRVKICGIRSAVAAQAACAAGADALGFVFYPPSPRAVAVDRVAEILPGLSPLVTAIGLFVDPEPAQVREVLSHCALDCLQFHGSESPAFCEQFERPYLKAIRMRPEVDLMEEIAAPRAARGLLLDAWEEGTPGGTGKTFDWELIGELPRPWILAGGLTPGNVGAAIEQVRPPAVDVSGGVERRRGEKDPARIARFMQAVREADARSPQASDRILNPAR